MAEAESVSARKTTLLSPIKEDQIAQVLRRRLSAVRAAKRDAISADAGRPETAAGFLTSCPLHPDPVTPRPGSGRRPAPGRRSVPPTPGPGAVPREGGR